MFTRTQLKITLLAATAVFFFNPDMMPKALRAGTSLFAQDVAVNMPDAKGLNTLLDGPSPASGNLSSLNEAFAPAAQAPVAAQVPVDPNATPGDNPFVRQAAPAAAPPPKALPAALSLPAVAPAPAPAAMPVVVNPFAPTAPDGAVIDKGAVQAPSAKIDISALRYYAASRDLKRLGAEMRRLKDLYPDWQAPKDLFSPVTNVDEQPLWNLYATGDYAAVRGQIARMQSVNPKWQPSDDLLSKVQTGEARNLIDRAFAQHRWKDVLSTAQAMPSIMTCSEMQVQWNVAEAFAQMRNYADAFDVYRYILTNCDDSGQRISTVQKASLLIPPAGITSLIALGRQTPDGGSEFDDIGFDGIRREIGAFIEHGDFTSTPSNDQIARYVDFIQRTGSARDANLVGWYFYAQQEWKTANAWFLQASKVDRDPKSIEGVILTLRQMEQTDDALKLARRYIKASPDIARQFIEITAGAMTDEKSDIKLAEADAALFEKVVTEQKSALGAQALGWKLLADGEKADAQTWFNDSVAWEPTEGGVVGLAVLAARAKNYTTLASLKAKYGTEYSALKDFKIYKAYKPKPRRVVQQKPVPVEKKSSFWFRSAS